MVEIINAAMFDSSRFFKPDIKTSERTTAFYEIELFVAGEGYSYIDAEFFPHKKGNLVFAPPGTKRCSLNRFKCLYIYLNPDSDTGCLLKDIPHFSEVFEFDSYENIFLEIIRLYQGDKEANSLLLQSRIYKLLDMIIKDTKSQSHTTLGKINADIIKSAYEFIKNNMSKPITLKDIANSVNFSPIYFHRAFTLFTGKTPHAYLLQKRLEAAKMQLLTTDLSMDEIADKCGFSSHSYFDYQFKKAYNITPSEFRRRKYEI